MLDIKRVRTDPEKVKAGVKRRGADMDAVIDELLDIEQDIEWGKFIYEQHTRNGTASITPEIAASFSLRDIECLVIFAMLQIIESKTTSVLSITLAVCIKELERRETGLDILRMRLCDCILMIYYTM